MHGQVRQERIGGEMFGKAGLCMEGPAGMVVHGQLRFIAVGMDRYGRRVMDSLGAAQCGTVRNGLAGMVGPREVMHGGHGTFWQGVVRRFEAMARQACRGEPLRG